MSFSTNAATINEISHHQTTGQQQKTENNGVDHLLSTTDQRQVEQNATEKNMCKFGAISCANCLKEKAKNEKIQEQHFQRQKQMLAKIDELQKSVFALKEGQSSIISAVEKQFSTLGTKLENKINELLNSSTALIGVQKDVQKSVNRLIGADYKELTKMYSNCWDAAACHRNLVISDSASNNAQQNKAQWKNNNTTIGAGILPTLPGYVRKSVMVKHNGKNSGFCSVFGKMSIPNGSFFYYEVTILHKHYDFGMHIGIATKQMPLHSCVGCHEGSYAYDDNGKFLGGGALLDGTSGQIGSLYYDGLFSAGTSGQSRSAAGSTRDGGSSAIDGTPSLDAGDIVGCGVNRIGGRITYTLNGKHLGSVNISVNASSVELFPCVSLCWPGDKIEANFGPVFKYPEGSYKI